MPPSTASLPAPIERYELAHPAVPPALAGLTILHLSDLHVRRPAARSPRFRRLLHALARVPADLVLLTGDYMEHPGSEHAAVDALHACARAWQPRLGAFGVFGNHDSFLLRRLAADVPGIRWLQGGSALVHAQAPILITGTGGPDDLPDALLSHPHATDAFTIALSHFPTCAFAAAAFGVPLLLSGHTHGGQIRPLPNLPLHTACDLPPTLASGVLVLDRTYCCISRGLGDRGIPVRLNCPPQAPLYVLTPGPMPDPPGQGLRTLIRW